MIDARRMEVYCLVCDNKLNVMVSTEAKIIEDGSFADLLDHNQVWFFGNGSDKVRSVIPEGNAVFVPDVELSATHLGELAYEKHQQTSRIKSQTFRGILGRPGRPR